MMKTGKKLWISFLLLVSCFWSVQAFHVPEPKDNFYVADYVGVISDQHAEEIREINAHLESINGSQIVVAVFDFLNGEDIADVAAECFNEWRIGSAEQNNGVLLLLAVGEDNYYCVQGKGLEYQLSASTLDQLLYEYLEPDFASGNYSEGVIKTVRQLSHKMEKLSGDPYEDPHHSAETDPDRAHKTSLLIEMALTVIIVLGVLIVVSAMGGRRGLFFGGPRYYGRPYRRTHYRNYSSGSSSYSRPSRPSRSFRSSGINRGGGGSTRGGGAGRRK